MVSKEEFNKVWKDSSRENILNQFYYEHYELFRIKKEVSEYIEKLLREEIEITDENSVDYGMKFQRAYFSDSELGKVLEILDKGDEK